MLPQVSSFLQAYGGYIALLFYIAYQNRERVASVRDAVFGKLGGIKDSLGNRQYPAHVLFVAMAVSAYTTYQYAPLKSSLVTPDNLVVAYEDDITVVLDKVDTAWDIERASVFEGMATEAPKFESSADAALYFSQQMNAARDNAYRPFSVWVEHWQGADAEGEDQYDAAKVADASLKASKHLSSRR